MPKPSRLVLAAIAAAAFDPNPTPGARPIPHPGSWKLLMFDPAD
jgi:hypothetical protein